jgi:hypothetical protein
MIKNNKNKKGFVALMSAIIISIVLLVLATTLSFTGFNSRFNILDSETKERSSSLADSCIDLALLAFAKNTPYTVNTTLPVGSDFCKVGAYTTSGSQKIFETQGIFSNSYTNLKVKIDGTTFKIISVEEIPIF